MPASLRPKQNRMTIAADDSILSLHALACGERHTLLFE
jgi:hypothetical protein